MYEYSCVECQKVFNIMVPLARYDEEIFCPHCGQKLERHISSCYFKVKNG